jgi:hypothetical protein
VYGIAPEAFFNGLIDEVQFYDRALTAEEIAAMVAAGSNGTCNPDQVPDSFAFVDQQDVSRGTEVTSDSITVSGIDYDAPIAIASCNGLACAYSVNGGNWLSTAGTVKEGDEVRVRQTSSSEWSTTTDLTLLIGTVTDTFSGKTQDSAGLEVEKRGNGSGTVTSEPGGIDCGAACEEDYASGTTVTLTAVAASDSIFDLWNGWHSVLGSVCTVEVNGPKKVEAHFTLKTYTVSSSVDGGHGELVCTSPVSHGGDSVCTVTPAAGYSLVSLRDNGADVLGAVSQSTCTITGVTEDHAVAAAFSPVSLDGPDLTAQWMSLDSAMGGKLVRGVLKVGNHGNGTARPSRVSLFLSADGVNWGRFSGLTAFRDCDFRAR